MYVFLSILILICALLLIGVILIQKSKGGGLASNFQGANQIMGVKSATNFVEKATWALAIIICLLSIISAFLAPADAGGQTSEVKAKAKTVNTYFDDQTGKTEGTAASAKEQAPAAQPAAPAKEQAPAAQPAAPAKK